MAAYVDSTGVTNLTADIKALADQTYPANAAVASVYSSSSAYSVGAYCIHDGYLYKCNTAIAAGGEAWNSSHWTQTSLASDKLSVSGDQTFSGELTIEKNTSDTYLGLKNSSDDITVKPASTINPISITFKDLNDFTYGRIRSRHYSSPSGSTSGNYGLQFVVANSSTNSNYFGLYINDEDENTVQISDPAAWRSALGAVNIAGDTMSGDLIFNNDTDIYLKSSTIDLTQHPSSGLTPSNIFFQDKNGASIGYLRSGQYADGRASIQIGCYRNVSGSNITNGINFNIADDGTRSLGIHAATWRNALNVFSLVVDSVTVDNQSLTASNYMTLSPTITKTNYTPIGIVGIDIANATTSGFGSSWCFASKCFVNSTNTKATMIIRNSSTVDTAKIKVTVYVLYALND